MSYGEPAQFLIHNKHLPNVNYCLNLPYDICYALSSIFVIPIEGVTLLLDEIHTKGRNYVLFRAPPFHWVDMI